MANKKLKVEVELETAKAKQQLGRMGDGVGVSSPTPSTRRADKLAEATTLNTRQMMQQLGRMGDGVGVSSPTPSTRSADKLTEATTLNTRQMMSMTRAFSGMALGLAASYSSRYFTQGSTAEKLLGYGGAAITGASAGAMMGAAAGPPGMAIGGITGAAVSVGKEYLDREKKIEDAIDEYAYAEGVLEKNEEVENSLKKITSSFNTEPLNVKLARLSDMYVEYLDEIEQLKKDIDEDLDNGDFKKLSQDREKLGRWRGYKNAIMSVAEKMDNANNGPSRASMVATDELMKLGGGFGLPQNGSGGTVEVLRDGIAVTNRLLEDIRANTGKKGTTWL